MAHMKLEALLGRIAAAPPTSPIAVFKTERLGMLSAVFASTRTTQQLIDCGDSNLIGVYDGSMDQTMVRRRLECWIKTI